jgi:hypothetical protein
MTIDVVVIGLDRHEKHLDALEHDVLDIVDTTRQSSIGVEVATHMIGGFYVASVALPQAEVDTFASVSRGHGFEAAPATQPPTGVIVEVADGGGRARSAGYLHHVRASGRLVRFCGQHDVGRTEISVAMLRARTNIEQVIALGETPTDDTVIVFDGYLRPTMQAGSTVLVVTALDEGRVRPFELEHPHQCCGGLH